MKRLSDPGLERTQRWMQAFILEQEGSGEEALRAPAVETEIPAEEALRLVRPSETLTAVERIGVYRDMYLARLGEALESDYPGVLHHLGEERFYDLAGRYLKVHPSRSFTLTRLGDHLPDFIAELTDLPNREFLHDLARLELALSWVFDAPESPVLGAEEIQAVSDWSIAKLKPRTAFRLLSFRYPVSEYLGAVDEENPFPKLRRRQTWVAAYRHDDGVHRLDLKKPAFELLSALAQGTPVQAAVQQSKTGEKQLFEWFRDWTAEGLFQSVS